MTRDETFGFYAARMDDVFARALEGGGFSRDSVGVALREWLAIDLQGDLFARMAQAGRSLDADVPLTSVFVDLRVSASDLGDHDTLDESTEQQQTFPFVEATLAERFPELAEGPRSECRPAWHLLIGGPGQGKSTLGQYLAQVHRATLLRPLQGELSEEQRRALETFAPAPSREALTRPTRPLFPLRVELRELASWLAGRDLQATDLCDFFAHDVQRITGRPMLADDLRVALARVPLLLVLDGLDEVAPSGGRDGLMRVLEGFLRTREAQPDLVVASTRPQGYDGEFRRFRTWHLAPLSKQSARRYAQMLIEAWLPGRVRDQQQKMERFALAAEEEGTARLLRSPLQVTILALIVGSAGRTPRSRWELFLRYYETIYAREQERGTYASELLAEHRGLIDSVHDLVGLVLQAEGETVGPSGSLLPRARLEEVIVHQLRERGRSEAAARTVAQEILQAASQRLVLLAELRPGHFGFDVRSLQEFMAARQLVSGDGRVVFERLRAIGRAAYWRNVLRFAVGSCFTGNTSAALRRQMSVQLCERVAADHAEESAFGSWPGAELALVLLDDSAVGVDLRCLRGLVRCTLPLLTAPWEGVVPSRLGRVLGAWWHAFEEDDVAAVQRAFQSAFEEALAGNAWTNVWESAAELSASQPAGIGPMLDAAWARLPVATRTSVLRAMFHAFPRKNPSWAIRRLEEEVDEHPIEFVKNLTAKEPFGPRAQAAKAFLWDQDVGSLPLHEALPEAAIVGWVMLGGAIDFGKKLRSPPLEGGRWSFFQVIRPFLDSPGPNTLAAVLRSLAESSVGVPRIDSLALPWPLAASLHFATTPEGLVELARRVETGQLGDEAVWRSMEASWRADGFSVDDLTHTPPIDLPFEPVPGGKGLPASARAGLDQLATLPVPRLDELLRRVRHARPDVRARVCDFVRRALEWHPRPARQERCPLSLEALEALWSPDAFALSQSLVFVALPDLRHLSSIEADRLDHLLLRFDGWGMGSDGGLTPEELAREVAAFWLASPGRDGALRLLSWLSSWRELPDSLRGHVDFTRYTRTDLRGAALLVQATLGELKDVPPDMLASEIVVIASEQPADAARLLLQLEVASGSPEAVLEALWQRRHELPEGLRAYLRRDLQLTRARRPAALSSPSRWAALELPAPAPLAPPPTDVAPTSDAVVHLTHLKLTNLRGFTELTLTPEAPADALGQWVVLLGENGVGKTTVLRGVAMALATPETATTLVGLSPAVHRRHETPRGTVAVTLNGHHFGAVLNGDPGHETVRADEFTASTLDAARPWVVGYGCRRGSALGGAKREVAFSERDQLDSLFDGDRGLVHAETWLVSQKLAAALAPGSDADARYQAILHVLRTVLGVEKIDVEADTRVWIDSAATGRTTLAGLSDGYVTTAGWVVDLLARWVNRCTERKKRLGDRFDTRDVLGARFHEYMTGVVLLDELDVYLHPRWQMGVIEAVRALFPRLSFVVTTHNPLTLLGARPREVWVLRRPEPRGAVHPLQLDLPKGVRIEHILTGAWFELDSTFDRDTRERLAAHREMLRTRVPPTAPERVEAERVLRERLVSVGDTWIERLGIEAARRVEAERAVPVTADDPEDFRRWVEAVIAQKPAGET